MNPTRIGWLAVAVAGAATAFVSVTLLNSVDAGTTRTGQLQHRLEATPPASATDIARLGDQVHDLATAVPTVVVTQLPGPPGSAGPPGQAGPPGTPGQIIVRTIRPTPAPVPSRTPRPAQAHAPSSSSTSSPSSSSSPTPTASATPTAAPAPCALSDYLAGECVHR